MLDILVSVLVAGLTSGAIYALASIGLSLVWGSMGMLNMAHAALLTLGGYMAFAGVTSFGLPGVAGLAMALLAGAIAGALLYHFVVRPLLAASPASFETNVFIATVGVGIALENGILLTFGGQPLKQPIGTDGVLHIGPGSVPVQNVVIMAVALLMMLGVTHLLNHTRLGRAIRATAQNREAALLMGVPVDGIYLKVLILSGILAALCGVLVSSITQLSPTVGTAPMLKAFIMCVVAGLGNLRGAIAAAFALAIIEAFAEFQFGARWGFPTLLLIVILVLVWRPAGLFGRAQVRRL